MSGTIVRAAWDNNLARQQYIAVNPLGDEVLLYETSFSAEETMQIVGRKSGFDNIQCLSYSIFSPGLTGVGQINGNISVFNIQNNSSIHRFRPKQSRPCNSLSFSGSMVAAAFDKGRQDNSLQLWNLEYSGGDDVRKPPVQSYVPNEAVLSTVFYPDRDSLLLCGSYKYLRELDLRSDQLSFQMATRCTLGLTVDPFDSRYFLSYAEDGSLAIWDRRKLGSSSGKSLLETPVLHFHKLLDSSRKKDPCLRYSSIRKGEFALIFNGELIRRWHTGLVPAGPVSTANGANATANSDPILALLKAQAVQQYSPDEDSLFVSLVLDVKTDYSRVISFDYSPDLESSTSTHLVCMRQSGLVFRMPVIECVESLDFNSSNEFSFVGPEGCFTKFLLDPSAKQTHQLLANRINDFSVLNHDLKRLQDDIESSIDEKESPHPHEYGYRDFEPEVDPEEMDEMDDNPGDMWKYLDTSEVLNNDICWTIRRRAILGYDHNCENNIKVLESIDNIDNQLALRNTWKWLSLAKKSLDKGTMISHGIDLGFLGVLGIWNGIEKLTNPKRFTNVTNLSDQLFSNTIKLIVNSKGKKAATIHIPSNSERKAQRKLCLIVSGWYFSDEEFNERLEILMSLGFYEKAAGWAVFHGHIDRAVEILLLLKKERLRLMATAVAAYLAYKNSNVNSPWKDQCRKMASELDNPYLRAIFAFIADNDWWDVLDEHSLPLRERLGVALRFLSDKDLTVYLNRIADNVVSKGELEGLILTGITARGVDLIQLYVDRTSDVQTAALMASFGSPRYISDRRIDHWVDCYRRLLNSWSLFKERAKFDVQRTKLSRTKAGASLTATPKQVYLQCPRCNKSLSSSKSSNPQNLMKLFGKSQSTKQDIRACPHCGAQLPRCSVCLLSLGTPVPTSNQIETLIESKFREWFSFCLNCSHGCHALHAEEWFLKHYICPVPDCNCRCNSL